MPDRDSETERSFGGTSSGFNPRDLKGAGLKAVARRRTSAKGRAEVAKVEVSPDIIAYIVDICRATRESPSISLGASPRGATALAATSRAWAWLRGRDFVSPDDVKALAPPTLVHRMQVRAEAELEGVTAATVLDAVLATIAVPR